MCVGIATGVAACASRPPPPPPTELAVPPLANANVKNASSESSPLALEAKSECTMNLFMGNVKKSLRTCYIDEKLSKEVGHLVVPCNGEGNAHATFGAERLDGAIHNGEVSFEIDTELDWSDGCHWGTHAVLRGSVVRNGAPIYMPIQWEYVERVLHGTGCVNPCRASASVDSAPTSSRSIPVPRDDGE